MSDQQKPKNGSMIWWRWKGVGQWWFGYVTNVGGGLLRMGNYHGDTHGGEVVGPNDIDWRVYRD